jgi:hypothetical protein
MQASDPSPEEIKIECLRIQESWSESERQKRAGCYAAAEAVHIPEGIDLGGRIAFIEPNSDSSPIFAV